MSLLEKLKAGTNNKKTIKFPGTEEPIVIRILSEGDRQDAWFAAERHFSLNKIEISMSTVEAHEAEKALQMIYRAITDAEGNPLTKTADQFRKLLSMDEKNALADEYLAFEKECSPVQNHLSEEELRGLRDDLKKNPKTLESFSDISIARQLISYLVNQPETSPKGSGSTY
jgi:hypothetical protein